MYSRYLYDTPRVIRAILEDLMEDLSRTLYGQPVDYACQLACQKIAVVLDETSFKGTPLSKLIHIEPTLEGASLFFRFVKRCDDGEWLLDQLNLIKETPQVPDSHIKKLSVKRVVDL